MVFVYLLFTPNYISLLNLTSSIQNIYCCWCYMPISSNMKKPYT